MQQPARRTSGAPEPWDESYRTGNAQLAWDIGEPQPALVELAEAGAIKAPVLDAGCGTGENSLMLAARGMKVLGVDWAPSAIAAARAKATDRGLDAAFEVADAHDLSRLGRERFATAIDCGLYHTFEADEAERYAASVRAVVRSGGSFFVLCFSDREPDWGGPHRIGQEQLRSSFAEGWEVRSIEPSRLVTKTNAGIIQAWLAHLVRS